MSEITTFVNLLINLLEVNNVMISPLFLIILSIVIVFSFAILFLVYRKYLHKRPFEKEDIILPLEKEETLVPSSSSAADIEELDSVDKGSSKKEHVKHNEEKYKFAKLSNEECKRIYNNLTRYVKKNKPYINPNLKISDLAHAINSSSHSLSYVFNQYLNQNYSDFVNEYRVSEFKALVNDSKNSRCSLTVLYEKSGFSSRASFFRAFKKLTGITPNEYIQQMKSSD